MEQHVMDCVKRYCTPSLRLMIRWLVTVQVTHFFSGLRLKHWDRLYDHNSASGVVMKKLTKACAFSTNFITNVTKCNSIVQTFCTFALWAIPCKFSRRTRLKLLLPVHAIFLIGIYELCLSQDPYRIWACMSKYILCFLHVITHPCSKLNPGFANLSWY